MAIQNDVRTIANNLTVLANRLAIYDEDLDDAAQPAQFKAAIKARLKPVVDAEIVKLQAVATRLS